MNIYGKIRDLKPMRLEIKESRYQPIRLVYEGRKRGHPDWPGLRKAMKQK